MKIHVGTVVARFSSMARTRSLLLPAIALNVAAHIMNVAVLCRAAFLMQGLHEFQGNCSLV